MTDSLRFLAVMTLSILWPVPAQASAQDGGPAEASTRRFQLPPRFLGLVHLGKGKFGSPAEAEAAGLVRHDKSWLSKAQAKRIPEW